MATGRQRFALQQLERAAAGLPDWPVAEVTAITVGGGTDGNALVTVDYQGATLKVPFLLHYTPVVGHVVALGRSGGNWIILGRPGGFPPAGGI